MTIDCAAVLERLWEFLDAELTADEIAVVARHLSGCDRCRGATAYDRALLDLLSRQRSMVPPVSVVWRVKVSLRGAAPH